MHHIMRMMHACMHACMRDRRCSASTSENKSGYTAGASAGSRRRTIAGADPNGTRESAVVRMIRAEHPASAFQRREDTCCAKTVRSAL